MLRLLLLIPTTTYRTEDFVAAAAKLDVELVVASERPNVLESALPDNLLTLDFGDPAKAARAVAEFARRHPVDAVVPVDDRTTVVGAAIAERLGLRSSSARCRLHDPQQAPDARGVRPGRRAVAALHAARRLRRSRGGGRPRDVPVRAQADDPRRQPRRDPGRRRALVRRGVPPDRGDPPGAGLGGARRGARGGAGRALHSRARGRARGAPGRGRAPRPGALRQARPARRAVLRGDDLRDALAPVRPTSSSRSRPRRAGRPGRSGSRRGRSTPSSA